MAILDGPPFFVVQDLEALDEGRGFTLLEKERQRGAFATLQVANGGDRKGEEAAGREPIDRGGEQVPLEIVDDQHEIPWAVGEHFGGEVVV